MARWLVRLEGEPIDLEEFPWWFPDGDIFAVKEDGAVYLVGSGFEKFTAAGQVHEVALQAVDEFSAIIHLLWTNFQRPTVGPVGWEDDTGHRKWVVSVSAHSRGRSKMRGILTVAGNEEKSPSPTQAQILLSGLRTSDHLHRAVLLWADPLRTWPRLFCVLEEIERYLGQKVDQEGFCSQNERKRFRQTANTSAAGKDARHAHGKFDPPEKPMDLSQGIQFIGKLLRATLARATADRTSSKM